MDVLSNIILLLLVSAALWAAVFIGYIVVNVVIWLLPLLITAGVCLAIVSIIYMTFKRSP